MPPRAQTRQEREAALDKRLDDSLGAFDAQLKKEQQKTAQQRDARQVTVASVASGADSSESGTAATEGHDESVERRTRRGRNGADSGARAGDLRSDKEGGSDISAGNGAAAIESPDGSDDDIIARRLRKAAQQETDPELKDKLWKEYNEYKKNVQQR
jgi:hypothetical protein